MGAMSLRRGLCVLALSAPLVLNAVDARAQPEIAAQSTPANPAESLSTILRQIRGGTLLKLHHDGRKWMEGELIRSTDSELVLTPDRFEDVTLSYARIDSLWIEHGNRMERGVFWGAIIGGLVGASVTYLASPILFNSLDFSYSYVAIGGIAGIGVGIGIGAWVGATTPDWKKLYPE